jgi:peptidyl-dipeptidase A
MSNSVEVFVRETVEGARPRDKAVNLAEWEAATTGTDEANLRQQQAQSAHMRYWADPEIYHQAKDLLAMQPPRDPLLARQLRLVYLTAAKNQQDEASIEQITRLEAEVRGQYYNFRGQVGGRSLSDNELDHTLKTSRDSAEVQAAWEASKLVGAQVAAQIRQLAHLRNAAARRQGFRDHFQRSLTLDEIDEHRLMELFSGLEAGTRAAFSRLKAEIDRDRATWFGIKSSTLMPWHYPDRFFQEAPRMGGVDMDALFAEFDPTDLALKTYDGLGLEVRDILARSDLYARPGKNQHAFCIHIDREGDVRTLGNLERNLRSNQTLHHELGHGVFDKYLAASLPWLLRMPSHTLTTEAVAILMGGVTQQREWLTGTLGLAGSQADKVARSAARRSRAAGLIFTRWCLVMTLFEKALYDNPDGDLDGLWWDLVERYQQLRRPTGRRSPDWAAKYHIALAPVYYQNYELGHLVTEQLAHYLKKQAGGLVGRKQAGKWLQERIFLPGAKQDWERHVATATGEPLNPAYFARAHA